jgi:hypothetical protein
VIGMRRCHGEPWTDSWTEPLAEVGATSVTGAWICGIRAGSAPRAPGWAPHNPPVVGSSPTRPTSMVFTFDGTPRQDSSLGVVPGHRHCHSRRPCQCPGLLRIPAALATSPPHGERARALPAPCDVPDHQEHQNDHDNQLNTHPDTSWRAELLRRGVGSTSAGRRRAVVLPKRGVAPKGRLSLNVARLSRSTHMHFRNILASIEVRYGLM